MGRAYRVQLPHRWCGVALFPYPLWVEGTSHELWALLVQESADELCELALFLVSTAATLTAPLNVLQALFFAVFSSFFWQARG